MTETVSFEKFQIGVKYGAIAESILVVIIGIIWLIVANTLTTFPIAYLTFGYGGLLLTIAGCIGPGRYQKDYKILLYTPESGSSFSDNIAVSGFTMDPSISKVNVMINGKKAGDMEFDENGLGRTTITRENIISEVINSIYLETEEYQSNSNEFTLFEYTEDMSDEEIDELYGMETREPVKSLEDAKSSYTERVSGRLGSVALGLGTFGVFNLLLGIFLNLVYGLN